MLLIRSEGDQLWTLEEREDHLKKVRIYIADLIKDGKLKSAQPLDFEGTMISGTMGKLKDGPFNESKEVIAGYYLIVAKDMEEAAQIGRMNPIFETSARARIEVRPIKFLEGINDQFV